MTTAAEQRQRLNPSHFPARISSPYMQRRRDSRRERRTHLFKQIIEFLYGEGGWYFALLAILVKIGVYGETEG